MCKGGGVDVAGTCNRRVALRLRHALGADQTAAPLVGVGAESENVLERLRSVVLPREHRRRLTAAQPPRNRRATAEQQPRTAARTVAVSPRRECMLAWWFRL